MQTVPLCELGEIVSGSTPKTGVPQFWDGDIPWITPADLSNHEGIYFHGTPKKISKKGFDSCSTAMLPTGSILFSSRAPIGHCALTAYPACTNQGFKNIVPNERLDPVYGYFALKFLTPDIIAMGRGATFAEINKEIFKSVQVPYCDLPEQRRIAGQLEKADRLVRTRRYALELTDTFLPAAFLEFFGDPVRNERGWRTDILESVATKITDGEHLNPQFVPMGFPIVMAEQVDDWGVNLVACKHVSAEDFIKFIRKCEPVKQDILIVSRGATIGRTCVVNTENPFCMMGSVILIKPNSNVVNPYFLSALLKSASFLRVLRTTSGASAQQAIYIANLKDKVVVVPPLPLQHKFAALVERVERLRAAQRESLRQAEHLFASLLHRAFSG
jgi:type I restriction enzyme S subunit